MVHSIIPKSQLEGAIRLDAEYYRPEYLELAKIWKTSKLTLGNIADCAVGFAFPSEDLISGREFPVIKMNNLTAGPFVSLLDYEGINDNKKYGDLNRFIVKKNDILVGLTGSLGSVALYIDDRLAYVNQRILRVRSQKFKPAVLLAILRSDIFRKYLERISLGGVQPNVRPEDAKSFPVAELATTEISELEKLMQKVIENTIYTKQLLEEINKKVTDFTRK